MKQKSIKLTLKLQTELKIQNASEEQKAKKQADIKKEFIEDYNHDLNIIKAK
ncbi:MAG: hypothetical protein M3R00_02625 [Pseudomonadota bacterium]|nr:hypothetical protein [Pseudomonadota bacterium]